MQQKQQQQKRQKQQQYRQQQQEHQQLWKVSSPRHTRARTHKRRHTHNTHTHTFITVPRHTHAHIHDTWHTYVHAIIRQGALAEMGTDGEQKRLDPTVRYVGQALSSPQLLRRPASLLLSLDSSLWRFQLMLWAGSGSSSRPCGPALGLQASGPCLSSPSCLLRGSPLPGDPVPALLIRQADILHQLVASVVLSPIARNHTMDSWRRCTGENTGGDSAAEYTAAPAKRPTYVLSLSPLSPNTPPLVLL